MRIPGLSGLASRGFRGALMQRGDGDQVIPNTRQRTALVPLPMNDASGGVASNVRQNSSFHINSALTINGVTAAQNALIATLGKGLWQINLAITAESSALTTNLAKFLNVYLQPPTASVVQTPVLWSAAFVNSGFNLNQALQYEMLIPTDDWLLGMSADAGVAADIIAFIVGVYGAKLA